MSASKSFCVTDASTDRFLQPFRQYRLPRSEHRRYRQLAPIMVLLSQPAEITRADPSSMRGSVKARRQRPFSRTKTTPRVAGSAVGLGSHSPREFNISVTARRTNLARSSVTQKPHRRGPVSSECSTPSGTLLHAKQRMGQSTLAANGCSPRSAAACITLIRLGQSTWAARLSWRGRASLNRGRSFV